MTVAIYDDRPVRLIEGIEPSHETAEEWYRNYGWHLDTEYAGSVEVTAVDYDWLDDDDDAVVGLLTATHDKLLPHEAAKIVSRARELRADADGIESLLNDVVAAYQRGDIEAVIEALEAASSAEREHGDDPATETLSNQLLAVVDTYEVDQWHVPPICQGQIVEVAYGYDRDHQAIISRTYDRSDRSVVYHAYEDGAPEGDFDPWNGVPALGDDLGECYVDEQV